VKEVTVVNLQELITAACAREQWGWGGRGVSMSSPEVVLDVTEQGDKGKDSNNFKTILHQD